MKKTNKTSVLYLENSYLKWFEKRKEYSFFKKNNGNYWISLREDLKKD